MNYNKTLEFLYQQLPCYQKIGQSAYKADLHNTIELLKILDNPHKKLRCIHIAGTNGKGSTSHITASILQESGYKIGLYTSPHLIDFRERIAINGTHISKKYVCQFVNKIKEYIPLIQPSFFEITVAMAFDYFVKNDVDFAVIETGLGGRLDSTNVITPILSVITNIGLDHTNILGSSIEEIAHEKAGIIKKNIPIIIGEFNNSTNLIFEEHAKSKNSKIIFADKEFRIAYTSIFNWYNNFSVYKNSKKILSKCNSPLQGIYQIKNIQTVIAICDFLQNINLKIHSLHIQRGIKNCITNTKLQGRWQIISKKPYIVCDTAHNFDGIKEVIVQIQILQPKDIHIIWGMVKDKDATNIIPLLPLNATYYITKPSVERGMNEKELALHFNNHNFTTYNSVKQAYKSAISKMNSKSFLYIGGSTFIVADLLHGIKK